MFSPYLVCDFLICISLYREKRSTLAEIVEQLQEREAAQVWRFHPNIEFICVVHPVKNKTNFYVSVGDDFFKLLVLNN